MTPDRCSRLHCSSAGRHWWSAQMQETCTAYAAGTESTTSVFGCCTGYAHACSRAQWGRNVGKLIDHELSQHEALDELPEVEAQLQQHCARVTPGVSSASGRIQVAFSHLTMTALASPGAPETANSPKTAPDAPRLMQLCGIVKYDARDPPAPGALSGALWQEQGTLEHGGNADQRAGAAAYPQSTRCTSTRLPARPPPLLQCVQTHTA